MAAHRIRRPRSFRIKAISLAVASCFSVTAETALANPTGGTVVSGTATFNQQGNSLAITNTPGAIINWRAFSIGTNEITRFIQQSSASSVLNRVVGVDPSVILGALQSNGRVFLINPNGILFGAGAQIDVAGLVASTLNLSNADFAAGRMKFTDTPGAGSINNQGTVTTPSGGQVYLIAPDIKNSGIISSPKGEVILAAGHTVELVDAGTPNLRIEITAPDTQAVNIGQIVANSGKIGIYAGLIKNSGEIRADGVVVGQNGEILLKATHNVTLDNGSVVSASGPTAGKVTIQADTGTVAVAGTVVANATQGAGGTINIAGAQGVNVDSTARISADGVQGGSVSLTSSSGSVTVAAPVTANATTGRAGQVAVSAAAAVTLATSGQLSASGGQGGGVVTANGSTGVGFDVGSVVQASGAAGGTVSAQADQGTVTAQGTIDVTATDSNGGIVSIAAGSDITLDITSRILARGRAGGEVRIESTNGTVLASGLIDGQGSNGPGGNVYLLAPRVALVRRALIDVTGATSGGTILLEASNTVVLDAGSVITAGGAQGGTINVQADGVLQAGAISADGALGGGGIISVDATSSVIQTESALISANGATTGGAVRVSAGPDGQVFTSGTLRATGASGGQVQVLGGTLDLLAANVDVAGAAGGGTILIGGDYQGGGSAPHATTTFVNFSTTLRADALDQGDGGKVVVWSDQQTRFYGSISARGGANGGNGGTMEVSSKQDLVFGGRANAGAPNGTAGSLLLDPHNIVIDASASGNSLSQFNLADPHSLDGGSFGDNLVALGSGNIVVTDTHDTFGGANAGAAYLFNGSNGALISALTGSHANDYIGSGGIMQLSTGNYLVLSPSWNSAAGAVSFGSATTGVNGVLSAANSLVGANPGDNIGSNGILMLGNNYIVFSPNFNGGAGAITFGDGTTGVKGTVGVANSLVGSGPADHVGADGAEGLISGNLFFHTYHWSNGGLFTDAGAVTWMNGANGKLSDGTSGGIVGSANSVVGNADFDHVGWAGASELPNGNVLVLSSDWNSNTGAVTWMNGVTGKLSDGTSGGTISIANSLIGSATGDNVGGNWYTVLVSGNLIIQSPGWSNVGADPTHSIGAVTWINSANGKLSDGISTGGIISAANSLVGSAANDNVGSSGVAELFNGASLGNVLVVSPNWNSGAGAVTWMNGSTGKLSNGFAGGAVGVANSVIGSFAGDGTGSLGYSGYIELANGNVIVATPHWSNVGAFIDAGAVTWINGANGKLSDGISTGGTVSALNSLVGSADFDQVGSGGIHEISSGAGAGNLFVLSPNWNGVAGAVTWMNGSTGKLSNNQAGGVIDGTTPGMQNSLIGSAPGDNVGADGGEGRYITELPSGNMVFSTPNWSNGATLTNAGAVTWVNGANGMLSDGTTGGVVSAANSLVGSFDFDNVGGNGVNVLQFGGAFGNVLVLSPNWNSGTGAATLINGSTGLLSNGQPGGMIDGTTPGMENSLIGSFAGDATGNGYTELANGNVIIQTSYWSNGGALNQAGAVTWMNGSDGTLSDGTTGGIVSASNSLVGNADLDHVGWGGVTALFNGGANGNAVILSPDWNGGMGAATWIDGSSGILRDDSTGGIIAATNSLIGSTAGDSIGNFGVQELWNGNFLVFSPYWNNGGSTANAGAVTFGDGTSGVNGVVSPANSLVGSHVNDYVGYYGAYILSNGNYLVLSPYWNGNMGAITFGTPAGLTPNTVSAANSLIGDAAGDYIGSGLSVYDVSGNYLLVSSQYGSAGLGTFNAFGAVTWMDGSSGVTGAVSTNSLIGAANGDQVGNGGTRDLFNGNYLVQSPNWNGSAGAFTFGTPAGLTVGTVGASNSFVGNNPGDNIVYTTNFQYLGNTGNWLISNTSWNSNAGFVAFLNSNTGFTVNGNITTAALYGNPGDYVGYNGIQELSTGNYLVNSPFWNGNTGAVSFGSGTTGVRGLVAAANSLVGSTPGDLVGYYGTQELGSGIYLVLSPYWNNGGAKPSAGAVTVGDSAIGVVGPVSPANSLVGDTANDFVGGDVLQLSSGNYLVVSPNWTDWSTGTANVGAVTFATGAGITGSITSANSLIGSTASDNVGSGGIHFLSSGDYLVKSPNWSGTMGAVTWGSGVTGVTGMVSAANSIVGANVGDSIGSGDIFELFNGNYLVLSPNWNGGMGAVTFGVGTAGVTGTVGPGNSLVGSTTTDHVGDGGEGFSNIRQVNNNYLFVSPSWNGNAGAVTLGSGTTGVSGAISSSNSIIGGVPNSNMFFDGFDNVNNTFLVQFPNEPGGRVAVGSNVFNTVVGGGNQLFGTTPASDITISPSSITATLNTGTAVILQANNDITLMPASDIVTIAGGAGGNLTLQAGRSIVLNSSITTDNGNLALTANDPGAIALNRDPGAAMINFGPGTTFNAGTGTVNIQMSNGSTAGDIATTGNNVNIIGSQISVQNTGGGNVMFGTGLLQATGVSPTAVDIGSTSGSVSSGADITSAGGVNIVANGPGGSGYVQLASGNVTNINAAGPVSITSTNDAIVARNANEAANITGSTVTLNSGSFIWTGVVPGQGNITATAGDVVFNAGSSVGSCGGTCWTGSVSAPAGNVTVNAGGFVDFEAPIIASPAAGTIGITASGIYAGGNMSAKTISLNSTDITLNPVNDVIFLYNAANITGGTINMQAVGNIYLEGVTLNATQVGLANAVPAITLASTAGNIYAPSSMSTVSGGVTLNASGFVEMDAASDGGIINSVGDVSITAGSSISAVGVTAPTAWMQIAGSNVTLNAGTFVNLGAVTGHGLLATNGNVNVTAGTSMGGFAPGSMKGPITAINGNVNLALGTFLDMGDAISAPNGTITVDNGAGGPIAGSINLGGPITANSNINLKAANFIDIGNGGIASAAGNVVVNSGDQLFSAGAISAGGTINLTSANGMSVLVASDGTNLTATNNLSGNLILTSNAPLFTAGAGGATITNNAPGGSYSVTAVNDMTVNGPTGNSEYEIFGAGNLLTVNGYSNLTGPGAVMVGNNVIFNGATNVNGALGLGVFAGNGVTFNGPLNVANSLGVTGSSNIAFNGPTNVGGSLGVAGGNVTFNGLTVGNSLGVTGINVTFNGATNVGGAFAMLAGGDVTFNGATTVVGALGVGAVNLNVFNTVQADSVSVTVNNLSVDGGNFRANSGSFSGNVTGNIDVTNGGIIYGGPDVLGPPTLFDPTIKALSVGGVININGPGSKIEAASPNSITIWFPLLTGSTSGGYFVNGSTGQVWDATTLTGFFAGGLPAVLGGSLRIYYGYPGLPDSVIQAINTTIAAIDQSVLSPLDKEAENKDEISLDANLKLLCN